MSNTQSWTERAKAAQASPNPLLRGFKMGLGFPDQGEVVARCGELAAESERLEKSIQASGGTAPKRPAFDIAADCIEAEEKLEAHVAQLRVALKLSTPKPQPQAVKNSPPAAGLSWTERAKAAKR